MKKQSVIAQIIAVLAKELEGYMRSAKAAHAEATHEQSKAENKYDTRGLEASYLARGQSRQAQEVSEAIQMFQSLEARDYGPKDPIDIGALVQLEGAGEVTCYFIGPRGGCTEAETEGKPVLVITPQSPMAKLLLGRRQGEHIQMTIGRAPERFRITQVT